MVRDIQNKIDEMTVEGDMVVTHSTLQGIYRQNGKSITSQNIFIRMYKDGKIIQSWRAYNNASIFKQLGISPPEP